jgi:hypothetical protein
MTGEILIPEHLVSIADRLKWLGDDELVIKDSFMVINPIYTMNWKNLDGWTESHTNSGSFDGRFDLGLLSTGATDNSRACVYETHGIAVYHSAGYNPRFCLRVNQYTASANKEAWFGLLTNPTAPTATEKHIAFKIDGADIYASCGDGTNGNLEDTGVDIGAVTTVDLYFKMVGTTIYFYINETLKVTFTTYAPDYFEGAKATLYVLNSAAEASTFKVYPLKMLLGQD